MEPTHPHDRNSTPGDALPALSDAHTNEKGPSRRDFLRQATLAGLAPGLLGVEATPALADHAPAATAVRTLPRATGAETQKIALTINGANHTLDLDPRTTLLDTLREHLNLTGSKKGCDHGQCGACTVHINGERSLSCLALAASHEGDKIVTIEGLAKGDKLHPMQAAFVEHDGYQCGYCTPGQIMSAIALIREGRAETDADIREGMSGNLCRCGAYPHILEAIKSVRDSKQRV